MKQSSVITTNLRISENLLRLVRIRALEEGLSMNEYLLRIIQEKIREEQILPKKKRGKKNLVQKKQGNFIERLLEISKIPNKPIGELSPDDKVIYET